MDRLLKPVHRWIWHDPERRVQKLLRFSETETDGGRDLLRAAELTSDPLLRWLYLALATPLSALRPPARLWTIRDRGNMLRKGDIRVCPETDAEIALRRSSVRSRSAQPKVTISAATT